MLLLSRKRLSKADKYAQLRKRIKELFVEDKCKYGYRRIHGALFKEDYIISEKVIRKIMKQEGFYAKPFI